MVALWFIAAFLLSTNGRWIRVLTHKRAILGEYFRAMWAEPLDAVSLLDATATVCTYFGTYRLETDSCISPTIRLRSPFG